MRDGLAVLQPCVLKLNECRTVFSDQARLLRQNRGPTEVDWMIQMNDYSLFDLSALEIAPWFIDEYADRLQPNDEDVKKLRELAEHFREPMKSIVEINDGEYIDIGVSANSWLPGANNRDRVVCNVKFDGIITRFSVTAIYSMDQGVILNNQTDLQGECDGPLTDFIFFRSVAEKIFRSESYKTFSEIYPFKIMK